MWWDSVLTPLSEVPDTHPNGQPVSKPILNSHDRWFASMYPRAVIEAENPDLAECLFDKKDPQ